MPSLARVKFAEGLEKGRILRQAGGVGARSHDRQVYYYASLAAVVAAWETYINGIVTEFFAEIATPRNYGFHALHTIAREEAERKLQRFHTPNWQNSRELLIFCTGYEPIHDWIWNRQGLGTQQVREFMNEILRVRHSFAHGYSMPSYAWNRSRSGQVRLTSHGLRRIESFFLHVVASTDGGIHQLIADRYGRNPNW